jgi:hypothetical protein
MSHTISSRLALTFLLAGALLPLAAPAQSQDSQSQTDSVAEAARRAREQKKTYPKPAPVITNDTLKPAAPASDAANPPAATPTSDSAQAPAAQAASDSSNAPAADTVSGFPAESAPAANTETNDQKAKEAAELADLKHQLDDAKKAVDLLQRELSLDQDTVYSNPNYTDDRTGQGKLTDLKQQIADKQQAVDALIARIAALEESSKGTAPAAPATPPQS